MSEGHIETLDPLLGTGGVLGFQYKRLVGSEDLKGFRDISAVLGYFNTFDRPHVQDLGHSPSSPTVLLLLASQSRPGQGEVAVLPFLEDPPLPTFLLLQLPLNNRLLISDEG